MTERNSFLARTMLLNKHRIIYNCFIILCFFFLGLHGAFSANLLQRLNDILKTSGAVRIITVTRGLGNINQKAYDGHKPLEQQRFEQLLRKIREICQKDPFSLKLVVFNEYFFQKTLIQDEGSAEAYGTKSYLVEKIKRESTACPNTLWYPNFLYKESFAAGQGTWAQNKVNDDKIASAQRDLPHSVVDKRGVLVAEQGRIPSLPEKEKVTTIFRNVTYGISKGALLTEYKKSSYCRECDGLIKRGDAIYDFGTGEDTCMPGLQQNLMDIAQKMIQTISTEICLDLAYGIRKGNEWKNNGVSSALHLIQSNTISPLLGSKPNDKSGGNRGNLPSGKIIVHVDPMSPHSAVPTDARCVIPTFFNRAKTNKLICSQENDQEIIIEEESETLLSSPNSSDTTTLSVWKIS